MRLNFHHYNKAIETKNQIISPLILPFLNLADTHELPLNFKKSA